MEVLHNPIVHFHCLRDTWTVPKYTISSHLYLGLVPVRAPDLSFILFHFHPITFPASPVLNHQLLCCLLVGNHHLHHTVFINTLFRATLAHQGLSHTFPLSSLTLTSTTILVCYKTFSFLGCSWSALPMNVKILLSFKTVGTLMQKHSVTSQKNWSLSNATVST